ncbi:hypothetical protein T492DRAFT_915397 [Pavlovales sp. CCMP2436]|nr:hypothetical protein T492DRAFT_915397 [Pavlovales sp. CCMP2436]
MHAHLGSADVQEWACGALFSIKAGNDAQGIARRQTAAGAGALPQIIAAMHAHQDSAAVQLRACGALANITAGADAQADARRRAAADAGALPQLVAAMHAHPGSAAVQEWACRALRDITAGEDAQGDSRRQTAKKARRVQIRLTAGAGVQIYAHRRAAADTGVHLTAEADVQGDARAQTAVDAGALPRIAATRAMSEGEDEEQAEAVMPSAAPSTALLHIEPFTA